jgi:lipoprotein-anchoring transpeptidase ErfK/SrfK
MVRSTVALALAASLVCFALPARAAEPDSDSDGLSDKLEQAFSSNPAAADSDGDGYADGAEVQAGYSPTDANPAPLAKRIEVTISKQELAYFLGDVELGKFPISSGVAKMPTPTGEFKIYAKNPRAWSKLGKLWMPYWMTFVPTGMYGIHELPEWPGGKKEGADHLGKPASHGCVRLGVGPAKLLYDWAPVGTKVVIKK